MSWALLEGLLIYSAAAHEGATAKLSPLHDISAGKELGNRRGADPVCILFFKLSKPER